MSLYMMKTGMRFGFVCVIEILPRMRDKNFT